MQSWKIIAIIVLAVVAVALITASAYAYIGTRTTAQYWPNTGTSAPYNGFGSGGMTGRGGMMGGYGYGNGYGVPPAVTNPQATLPSSPIKQGTIPGYTNSPHLPIQGRLGLRRYDGAIRICPHISISSRRFTTLPKTHTCPDHTWTSHNFLWPIPRFSANGLT